MEGLGVVYREDVDDLLLLELASSVAMRGSWSSPGALPINPEKKWHLPVASVHFPDRICRAR